MLRGLQPIADESSENKGIVCNIDGFDGVIHFEGNKFENNMVFIPSAAYANNQKFNHTRYQPNLDDFVKDGFLEFVIQDETTMMRDVHYLNYMDPEVQFKHLKEKFIVQTTMFLAGINNKIIFENNEFDNNIGTVGGAIHLDLSSQ